MPTTKLICTTALKTTIEDVQAQFERQTGRALEALYGPSAQLTKRLTQGEPADIVMLTGPGIEEMIAAGKVVAGSGIALASSQTMVGVKKGTPRPDISTVEKFKQAMLNAKSIAYSGPGAGASGAHIAKIFADLGIIERTKSKTVLGPGGPAGLIGNYLVRGEAEIGMQQDAELMMVPGVDIVGPLPPGLELTTTFVFGVHSAAQDGGAGKVLGPFLRTLAARAVMKAKGLTPAQ
jgi:molybdate transport system substrate-binding protein